ncbi:MAG: alpha/beta fold hydrolase [Gammaproteobacteria bacterium]|nr:alpha/beta fold hydrolase [Gammaproteobacteria bacterium]
MALFCPAGTHYQTLGKPLTGIQTDNSAVVFIHGVGLDLNLWQNQTQAFESHYHVITYDMLGHGLSPNAEAGISLNTLSHQLVALIDHLQLHQIHLVGFSLGGLVARVFATQHHHRLKSLTIMNSVFDRDDALRQAILLRVKEVENHGPSANIDQALTRWFSPLYTQNNSHYLGQLKAKVLANHGPSYSRCYRLFGEGDNVARNQLGNISCPTLITTGELDPGSTPAMSHALAAHISSAQVAILPNARHMMPIEKAREVNQLLKQFINVNR